MTKANLFSKKYVSIFMKNLLLTIPLLALVVCFQSTSFAQKKPTNTPAPTQKLAEDEKKYEMLKAGPETIWTCENNVKVKTAKSGNSYLFLFNKKLYTMSGIEALNGISHFTDMVHRVDWFIIPGKAMLFDSKAGQRLLDYCSHPELASIDKTKEVDLMK
jgi:hypothetical protein